jgi:class 3 adenylate cyclase
MAVFRGDFHLDRAIDTCLSGCSNIETLPKESNDITFLPQVSIGINSGELISGNIGSATLRRLDYTVVGDVANTAARLQSVAQPGQIVISDAAYEKVRESFNCKPIGTVGLKNKANPVMIYEVVD